MEIPTPPTDNFYKFFAVSGVVTALASAYWFISSLFQFKDALTENAEQLQVISLITQWGLAVGCATAALGFAAWFYRVQLPLDRELAAKSELAVIEAKQAKLQFEISSSSLKAKLAKSRGDAG